MAQPGKRFAVGVILAAVVAWLLWPAKTEILTAPEPAGQDAAGQPSFWFKGNTHAHARLEAAGQTHGDATPAEVAKWYHDHGYHFLAITDHNRFTTAGEVPLPDSARPDFLLLSGMEITSDHRYPGSLQAGERKIHSTALGTMRATDWRFDDPDKAAILTAHAERVLAAGGVHVINHPNYKFQLELDDVLGARGARLMEIANVHPRSNAAGHGGFRPAVETLWDQALSRGRLLYGVATDDAHDFAWFRRALRWFGYAPPGGGWVMVRAARLAPQDITEALRNGDFYASTGVHLKRVRAGPERYEIEVDMERTRHETRHRWIRNAAPIVASDDTHFVIEFIGSHGRLLHAVHDQQQASLPLVAGQGYVRGRVTYLEKGRDWLDLDRARAFHAWTQPVMVDAVASAE